MDHKAQNQCELCYQFSHSGSASSTGLCVVLYMLACGAVLLTVCGNLLVIISICCFKHLHTPTNLILLSLAVADLLVGLTVMPFHFSLIIESAWYFGTVACKFFHVFSYIMPCAAVYNVVFIAVDRHIAVRDPFLYNRKMTIGLSLLVISFIWGFSILYSLGVLYWNGDFHSSHYSSGCVTECIISISEISGIVDLICVFVIPYSLIIFLYVNVFFIARKHINVISKHPIPGNTDISHSVASERKAATKLGILIVVFLVCTLPSFICVFVSFKITNDSVYTVFSSTLSLTYLNSTVNPIVYALFYHWFRKCVKHILTLNIFLSESTVNVPHVKKDALMFTVTK